MKIKVDKKNLIITILAIALIIAVGYLFFKEIWRIARQEGFDICVAQVEKRIAQQGG